MGQKLKITGWIAVGALAGALTTVSLQTVARSAMAPLPLEEAQARLLALAIPLPVERLCMTDAQGRDLAVPLLARRTQPAADLSAMDGYAVHSSNMVGPWQVVGESSAGHP